MTLPKMIRVRQKFPSPVVDDLRSEIFASIEKIAIDQRIKSGDSVAIGAGSRGIADIAIAVKATADALKKIGAKPFIFPAMGSHGGATIEGQTAILGHYGISAKSMAVPICATMDAIEIGQTADDLPVFLDAIAHEADHVVPINRVKSHTDFRGSVESGLMKMLAIGVGKQRGANMYHKAFFRYGFERVILTASDLLINSGKIAFGVALIENAYGQTVHIEAIPADQIITRERELLIKAKSLSGRLPFDTLDLLIVDWIGKNISGTGMDTNVIGRFRQNFEREPEKPSILRIFVRDLTPDSGGNGTGIGLADFTTTRFVEKFDRRVTYMNGITSLAPQKSQIPYYYDTDREALKTALVTIGLTPPELARVVRIENTLRLSEVEISEALIDEVKDRTDLELIGELKNFEFNENGDLTPF